ncbi:MAG: bifunctional response regulator/alkaline phosphatase family protein [Bacteroidales bacterium]
MRNVKILWTDDEIDVLKPHILFLTEKGYEIDTCSNGTDTIDLVRNNHYDIVFLDEHMPGLSGIETLRFIRQVRPELQVVMVTKSEEEDIMEAAIGSEIADYLIKPVKPNQILLCIKRLTDQKRLVTEKTTGDYRQEFSNISSSISAARNAADWASVFRKLIFWELELEKSADPGMSEILATQENEANIAFSKFISSSYLDWFNPNNEDKPLLSPSVMQKKVFPHLSKGQPVFFIVIDNLRYDQWKTIPAEINNMFRIVTEDYYYSILPTATQYSRNALFAGLMPLTIAETMPSLWIDESEEESKNSNEEELLSRQITRAGLKIKWTYTKVNNSADGKKLADRTRQLLDNDLNVIVFNFVDMLSHARTEIGLIRDLAADEKAYRSLVRSWFIHSPLYTLLDMLSGRNVKIIFTTDHGTIRVQNPVRIVGDRNTSANLRYKMGRNLDYRADQVFEIKNPEKAFLPKSNISSRYIFALNKDYLVYQNNFNQFATYYRDTFQHGGISMQEIILPLVVLEPLS